MTTTAIRTVPIADGMRRVVDAEGNSLGCVQRVRTAEGERWDAFRPNSSVRIGWTSATSEEIAIDRVVTAWEEEHHFDNREEGSL